MSAKTAPPSRARRTPRERRPVDVRAWLGGIRLSGFMVIMLGLVVLAAFVLVPTIGTYVDQRQRIAALALAVSVSEDEVADLKAQRERWRDPAYITTQARERLYYVKPGEVVYLVDNDLTAAEVPQETDAVTDAVGQTRTDWMSQLVRSVTEAGLAQTATTTPSIGVPDPTPSADARGRRLIQRRPSRRRYRGAVTTPPFPPVAETDLEVLRAQLGRPARGVVGIAARCVCGNPTVAATLPRLPDGTPFPTFYYLTHPAATAAMSTLEAGQVMRALSDELADEDVAAAYGRAHLAYIADRDQFGDVEEIDGISAGRHADPREVPARARRARPRRRTRRQPDRRPRARAVDLVSRPLRLRTAGERGVTRSRRLAGAGRIVAIAALLGALIGAPAAGGRC